VLQVLDTIAATRAAIAESRPRGSIGFVPTMGALHAGHASLIQRARAECGTVIVSVFVNPLQFDRPDDLERYPRSLDPEALKIAQDLGYAPASPFPPAPEATA